MRTSGYFDKKIKAAVQRIEKFAGAVLIFIIQAYRVLVSPHLGQCCRFYPSCSAYAQQAIEARGMVAGICLAVQRLLKCQPFHPGGIDVVETRT